MCSANTLNSSDAFDSDEQKTQNAGDPLEGPGIRFFLLMALRYFFPCLLGSYQNLPPKPVLIHAEPFVSFFSNCVVSNRDRFRRGAIMAQLDVRRQRIICDQFPERNAAGRPGCRCAATPL